MSFISEESPIFSDLKNIMSFPIRFKLFSAISKLSFNMFNIFQAANNQAKCFKCNEIQKQKSYCLAIV